MTARRQKLSNLKPRAFRRLAARVFGRRTFRRVPDNILADLFVTCSCGASEGKFCRGLKPNTSHIGRRVSRLLKFGALSSESKPFSQGGSAWIFDNKATAPAPAAPQRKKGSNDAGREALSPDTSAGDDEADPRR